MQPNPNAFAYIALVAWFPITFVLFHRLRPEVATACAIIGGTLFLPERTHIDLPLFPDLDKSTIPALAALAGCMVTSRGRLAAAKPFRGIDRWYWLLVLGTIGTWLTNRDPMFAVPPKPGLTPYDALSDVLAHLVVVWLVFFLGRSMFSSLGDLASFLRVGFLFGLAYIPLCLIELRLSPQLHNWIYGFMQHSFGQTLRGGGYRPMVFMEHGLVLARFMLVATLSGTALTRTKLVGVRLKVALWFLIVVFVALKSTGAIVLGVLFLPLVAFASVRMQLRVAVVLALLVAFYPTLRSTGLFPVEDFLELASKVSAERAQSLGFRFDEEDSLLAKARERMVFGWGGYGRSRVIDPTTGQDVSVTDGEWVIVLGVGGLAAFVARYGMYLAPALLVARRMRRIRGQRSRVLLGALALITVVLAIDTIPNASMGLPHFLWSGALYGSLQGVLRQDRLQRLRALRERRGTPGTADPVVAAR